MKNFPDPYNGVRNLTAKEDNRKELNRLTKNNVYSFLSKYAADNKRGIMQDLNDLVGKKNALNYAEQIIIKFIFQAEPFKNTPEYKNLKDKLTELQGAKANNPKDGLNGKLAREINNAIVGLMNLFTKYSNDIQ